MHIALLEDNPAIIDWLTFALQMEGHTVSAFTDGSSLLKTLFNNAQVIYPLAHDLLICDLYLPDSPSGKDVITYIHEAIPPDKLPLIIISGTGLSEIEHLRYTFPAYVVLRKPFSIKELAQQIKNLQRRLE